MSEKLQDRALQRPQPASASPETSPEASPQTALSVEQRTEAELAKIDEEMDRIMARPGQQQALMNPPGQALQPAAGRSMTPSVSAPADASGLQQMVLNFIVPGGGSLMRGAIGTGALQFGMAVASVPVLFFVAWWLGVLMFVTAWVWSAYSGVRYFNNSTTKSWR